MKHYAGIDVSLKDSHVCIVDAEGRVVSEAVVASEPEALAQHLLRWQARLERVGLEAGPLSQWLHAGLRAAGLPVTCIETRHLKAALSAMRVKTDRNDARAIAQVMRVGWYRAVHVKSRPAQEQLALVTARKLLVNKLKERRERHPRPAARLRAEAGHGGAGRLRGAGARAAGGEAMLSAIIAPLLMARAALRTQLAVLHRQVLQAARHDEVCRRLMTTPGVGAGGRAHLQERGRRSRALRQVQGGGRAFRADAHQVPVRRDRPNRADQQGRRRAGADRAL